MYDLIRSNEFGDWLVIEISRTRLQSKSADAEQSRVASLRLDSLKVVKHVLLDYLLIQQAMFDAASEAGGHRSSRSPRNGHAVSTVRLEIDAG